MNIINLRQARKSAGLTQQQAADAIGVVQSAYKNYEQGNREPKGDILVKLADLFGVTTDYLLGRNTEELNYIDKLEREFNMNAIEKKILENYFNLPNDTRQNITNFLDKAIKGSTYLSKGEANLNSSENRNPDTYKRIKQRRKELGLSAESIAEMLDISAATMYRYENNEIKKIPIGTLKPLAAILHTTPEYLMGCSDSNIFLVNDDSFAVFNDMTNEQIKQTIEYANFLKFNSK